MTLLVPIIMLGWIPIVLALFVVLPPRRAVISAFLLAWLFLPVYSYEFGGLPDYTKMSATCVGVFIGVLFFDTQRIIFLKFQWLDIPMLLWCLCPIVSSLSNDLGIYDGLSTSLSSIITWGLPYIVGRMYFNTLNGLRELAIGIFIGGLIYVPFCLFEIRMSPQLHHMVYGFHQHDFAQTIRFGGYRPTVFMQHGLAVSLWMTIAFLVGIWLKLTGVLDKLWIFPIESLLLVLLITTVLCKSGMAFVLLIVGLIAFITLKCFRSPLIIAGLLISAPTYIIVRSADIWAGAGLVQFIRRYVNEERAGSLQFRIDNEEILKRKALQRPMFGWGGWGRSRVYDENGRDISVTDSLWIIVLGKNGVFGLICLTVTLLLPVVVLWRNYPPRMWAYSAVAPAAALAVMINLYLLDNLLNNMVNPIFLLAVGGLIGLVKQRFQSLQRADKTEIFAPHPWRSENFPIWTPPIREV